VTLTGPPIRAFYPQSTPLAFVVVGCRYAIPAPPNPRSCPSACPLAPLLSPATCYFWHSSATLACQTTRASAPAATAAARPHPHLDNSQIDKATALTGSTFHDIPLQPPLEAWLGCSARPPLATRGGVHSSLHAHCQPVGSQPLQSSTYKEAMASGLKPPLSIAASSPVGSHHKLLFFPNTTHHGWPSHDLPSPHAQVHKTCQTSTKLTGPMPPPFDHRSTATPLPHRHRLPLSVS
jgi:hypothetical protein